MDGGGLVGGNRRQGEKLDMTRIPRMTVMILQGNGKRTEAISCHDTLNSPSSARLY